MEFARAARYRPNDRGRLVLPALTGFAPRPTKRAMLA